MKVAIVGYMLLWSAACSLGEERARVLCGRNLAEARQLYCFSAEETRQKRFDPGATASTPVGTVGPATGVKANQITGTPPTVRPDDTAEWIWRQRQVMALASRAKRMPGLVDECCYKACYVSELLNYC